ncbi:MAG: hypothetical protein ACTSR2_02490, partial [Candidatus Hodarchaeales archaeon]
QPKTDLERIMAHYGVDEEQAKKLIDEKGIDKLLPPRGTRLEQTDKRGLDMQDELSKGKGITERNYKFQCLECSTIYEKKLPVSFKGIETIRCPECGSTNRKLKKERKKIKGKFHMELFKEQCGIKKKEDITTSGSGGALSGTVIRKQKKIKNFVTETFKNSVMKNKKI